MLRNDEWTTSAANDVSDERVVHSCCLGERLPDSLGLKFCAVFGASRAACGEGRERKATQRPCWSGDLPDVPIPTQCRCLRRCSTNHRLNPFRSIVHRARRFTICFSGSSQSLERRTLQLGGIHGSLAVKTFASSFAAGNKERPYAQSNDVQVDRDTGLIYMADRWGLGLHILEYTGG